MAILPRESKEFYKIGKAKCFWIPAGRDSGYDIGNLESFAVTLDVTTTDFFTNEDGIRVPVFSENTEINATVSFVARNQNMINIALQNLSEEESFTQEAIAAGTYTWNDPVRIGMIINIPDTFLSTPTSLKVGAANTFVLGQHYLWDGQASTGKIVAFPVGFDPETATDPLVMLFTAPEYKAALFGGFSNVNGLSGTLILRDTNPNGPKFLTRFHNVQVTPDGDQSKVSDSDLNTASYTGRIFQDPTKPSNRGFYDLIALPGALA